MTFGYPLQVAGLVLGSLGTAGTLLATLLPQWRVSAFIGSNIVVFERIWEGLWMSCVRQARIRLQCKFYPSLLALPPALEAARALMCVAVVLSLLALLIGVSGAKRVRCAGSDERVKGYLLGASGAGFILSAIVVLIPVCWTANIVIQNFYDPAVHPGQKRELGAALFLGWACAGLLAVAGALLGGVCCCRFRENRRLAKGPRYPSPRAGSRGGGPGGGPAGGRGQDWDREVKPPIKTSASYV
ncbi:claudin-17-like [Tachyglossus aculeatus]|uniref:claudin-17-like n=1 Tax=Tachyglossus aculeatus TaxID=9261 RepID=UPI0018F2D502|nr:claudin-17-like [Tachyglossus aculeatus]